MRNLDTTERITMLCDGDRRLISLDLEHNRTTIEGLRFEYFMYLYHNGDEELTKAVINVVKFWEEKKKAITELWDKIKETLQLTIEPIARNNRQRARRDCNNYRKLHHLPQIRRPRCRWRPRESRRRLEGLSPGTVVIDELHEWKG